MADLGFPRRKFLLGLGALGAATAGAPLLSFGRPELVGLPDWPAGPPSPLCLERMRLVDEHENDIVQRLPVRLSSFACPWSNCEIVGFEINTEGVHEGQIHSLAASFGEHPEAFRLPEPTAEDYWHTPRFPRFLPPRLLVGHQAWLDLDGNLDGGFLVVQLVVRRLLDLESWDMSTWTADMGQEPKMKFEDGLKALGAG